MSIVGWFKAMIRAFFLGALGYQRVSKHAKQGKRNRRKKPLAGMWRHKDAVPHEFKGRINFRRSDPRHLKHPQHAEYMRLLRKRRDTFGFYSRGYHNDVLYLLKQESMQ